MLGSTKMITSTYCTSSDGRLAPGWLQSTATCGALATFLGGLWDTERLEEIERGWRSSRVPRQFVRWFYRSIRGQFCHFTAGNGRDAATVTSSFLSTNPLANTSGGPQLYRHKFLAGCWGPGWSLSAMRSENLHGLSLSTLRLRLKTMHCKATPHPGK
jgi:hypothetical protein